MNRLIAGLFLIVLSGSLHAQTMDMRATIPFAFRAGETVMPAGEYTVRHSANNLFLHKEGGPSVVLLTNAAARPNLPATGRLDFSRYGEEYFLSSLWTQGSRDGCAIPKSRAEKEVAIQARLHQSIGIALRRQ